MRPFFGLHLPNFGAPDVPPQAIFDRVVELAVAAEDAGFGLVTVMDHVYQIGGVGPEEAPMLEAYTTLGALAARTSRVRLGTLVTGVTYRNPALLAKTVTTLDAISRGRAVLGIGAAWNENEAHDFGVDMGSGMPERLRWLGEALPLIRGILHGEVPTAAGSRYHAVHVRNDPAPLQTRLPILVGGGGEKVTLKLVAQYADACNLGGGIDMVRRKDQILREHCDAVGRDESEIERTVGAGVVVIRDSRAEAERVYKQAFATNRIAEEWEDQPIGTVEDVAEKLAPYLEIGYRHLIVGYPAPYDEESAVRLANEVRPMLENAR